MNRRTTSSILVAFFLLAPFGSQLANAEMPATADTPKTVYATPLNTTFEISNLKDEDVIRVDLVFQPGVKMIVPNLKDVAIGERHDQSLMELFKPVMEELPPDSKALPALLIKVKPKSLRHGSYKLRIEVLPVTAVAADKSQTTAKPKKGASITEPPASKKPQVLDLELKLPATQVKVTEKLVIHQVSDGIGIFAAEGSNLNLTAFSQQNVRLTDVRIAQVDLSGKENVANSLKVNFATVPEIAPNATGQSAITLEGTFPLEGTTGAALISAPQLAAPVWLPFEVKGRRAKWIIVAVMILGLVLGFVARIWTKQRIELQEARQKGLDAYLTLQRERQRRPDKEFRRQIDPAITTLETSVKSGKVETLKDGITAANTALTQALKDLDVRRATAKSQLEALNRLAKKTQSLPPAVAEAVTIDGPGLEKARGQLELDDVASAQETLTPIIANLAGTLGPAASAWRGHVKSLLEQVAGISPFLRESVASDLTVNIATVNSTLDAFVLTTADSSLDDISTLFGSLRNGRDLVSEFMKGARRQLADSLDSLKSHFETVITPKPKLVNDAFKTMAELLEKFHVWAERPETAANELLVALDGLSISWPEALLTQITSSDADLVKATKDTIGDLLEQHKYRNAAMAVVAFLSNYPPDSILGPTAAPAGDTSAFSFGGWSVSDLLSGRHPDVNFTMVSTVREQTLPPNLEALSNRTWKELALAKAMRFAIASLVILVVGYGLFAQTFIGTLTELMSVFVWAFGLNISVDTVADSIKTAKLG